MGDGIFAIGTPGMAAIIREAYAPQFTTCIELTQEQCDMLTSRQPVFRTFPMLRLPGDGWVMVLCGESEEELMETFKSLGFAPADAKLNYSDFSAPEPPSENVAAILAGQRAARDPGPIHLSREELVPPGGSPDVRIDLQKIDAAVASAGGGPRVVVIDLRTPAASSETRPPPPPPPAASRETRPPPPPPPPKAAETKATPPAPPGPPVVMIEEQSQGFSGVTFEAPTSPGQPRVIRAHTSQPARKYTLIDELLGPRPKAILGALAFCFLSAAVYVVNKGDNVPSAVFAALGALAGFGLLGLGESSTKVRSSWRPRAPKLGLVAGGLFITTAAQFGLKKSNYLGSGFLLVLGLFVLYAGVYYEELKR